MAVEGSLHKLVRSEKGSDVLLVSFASAAARPPRFSLYKTCVQTGANVLFVNDELSGWYRRGVLSMGPTEQQTVAAIAQMAQLVKASRVVCVGSSMGGFGALRYSALLGADDCLATDFEIRLGIKGARSQFMGGIVYGDYMTDIARSLPKRAGMYYSHSDLLDVMSAAFVPSLTSRMRLSMVRAPKHASLLQLQNDGNLDNLLADLVSGESALQPILYPEIGIASEDNMGQIAFDLHTMFHAGCFAELLDACKKLPDHLFAYPLMSYLKGMGYYRTGDLLSASLMMQQAVPDAGGWIEPLAMLGVIRYKLGDLDGAIEHLKAAVSGEKVNSVIWNQLGEIYEKAERISEAYEAYNTAARINPSSAVYKKSVDRLKGRIKQTTLESQDV